MARFGDRLRAARVAAGLTQAELGEPAYSRSYISLLESGTRPPTTDALIHLGSRLSIPAAEMRSWAAGEERLAAIEIAAAQVETMLALSSNDSLADDDLPRVAEASDSPDLVGTWLTSSILRVLLLLRAERYADALVILNELSGHWSTVGSPLLAARVESMRGQALRLVGELADSVEASQRAIAFAQDSPRRTSALVNSYATLVSALVELGREREAVDYLDVLHRAAEQSPNRYDAGRALWAAGNLAFILGRHAQGIAVHEQAFALIDPDRQLRIWGRLHRSSAAMRVLHGAPLDDVPRLLDVATAVFALSAGPSDEPELQFDKGLYARACSRWSDAAGHFDAAIRGQEFLAPQTRADTFAARADVRRTLGDEGRALADANVAVRLYVDSGAFERAFRLCQDFGIAPPQAAKDTTSQNL